MSIIKDSSVATLGQLEAGAYVVAVSGGVDSMALLHMLQHSPHLQLIVAHYDHDIRPDSREDRLFVQRYAMSHNLRFVYGESALGPSASEATARQARYNFLRQVCKKHNALALVTAHHQDDVLETAIINMLRGTGRRGLSSLQSHGNLRRPLLHLPKSALVAYAKRQGIQWRHDTTNDNQAYARNYVRHQIVAKMSQNDRDKLHEIIVRQKHLNQTIDQLVLSFAKSQAANGEALPRYTLTMSPPAVATELLQAAVKKQTGNTMQRPLAERALLFAKTARPNKYFELCTNWRLASSRSGVIVEPRPSMIS